MNRLTFIIFAIGNGNMNLLIFPNGLTLLYDCNITNENYDNIMHDLDKVLPKKRIDIFVNSHRDDDHYRGLRDVNKYFPIHSIWDSTKQGKTTDSEDYRYYMGLKSRLSSERRLYNPEPSYRPIMNISDVKLYCLCSYTPGVSGVDNHYHNIVLMAQYGRNKLLLNGDSDYLAWEYKIMPYFETTELLSNICVNVASHHGSKSFFTEPLDNTEDLDEESVYTEHLKMINPNMTLISCSDNEHHPNRFALKMYKKYSFHTQKYGFTVKPQVYDTNRYGNFFGMFFENNEWTVMPDYFVNIKKYLINIQCTLHNSKSKLLTYNIRDGNIVKRGGKILFIITPSYRFGNINNCTIEIDISNHGIDEDDAIDEFYSVHNTEIIKLQNGWGLWRNVVWKGSHYLRACIYQKNGNLFASRIFNIKAI